MDRFFQHVSQFFTPRPVSLPPQHIDTLNEEEKKKLETASFAAGCFWSVELVFQREPGVVSTTVGYMGGHTINPTYEDICTGTTNHAETVQLQYDPSQVSYSKLLSVFWSKHDPTTLNRQGNDAGTQYRSVIFTHTPQQHKEALESKQKENEKLRKSRNRDIVTEIVKAGVFYKAENYHQRYLEKGGQCAAKGDKTHIRCYG